ncbi:MAG: F0F1 ATP synthase subunit B [Patescibacteria group bacterium]
MSEPITTTAHETVKAVEATGGLGMLGINAKIFIAQLINFVIVLLVLWKAAYKPLVKLLDERSARIEKSMNDSKEIEARLEATQIEQGKLITEAKSEAASLLEKTREEAEAQKIKLTTHAKEEVQKIIASGKDQLQAEKVAMLREAKTDIVEMAMAAAKKILAESVDEKSSQKIAQDVVERMSK